MFTAEIEILQPIEREIISVRDLPFERISGGRNSLGDIIEKVKNEKKGTCSGKHYLLGQLLELKGIPICYISYPFLWSETPINFPDKLAKLAKLMPPQNHLLLGFGNDGNVLELDVTWDKQLEKLGLPVFNFETGTIDPNRFFLKPIEEPLIFFSGQERWNYIQSQKGVQPYPEIVTSFYSELAIWFNNSRLENITNANIINNKQK